MAWLFKIEYGADIGIGEYVESDDLDEAGD